jgi:hypothetical protein
MTRRRVSLSILNKLTSVPSEHSIRNARARELLLGCHSGSVVVAALKGAQMHKNCSMPASRVADEGQRTGESLRLPYMVSTNKLPMQLRTSVQMSWQRMAHECCRTTDSRRSHPAATAVCCITHPTTGSSSMHHLPPIKPRIEK